MPISLSQHVDLQCPECNAPFRAEVWLIVDAGERADLAARCRDGTLHRVTCPNGHTAALGAPLLYHDRAREQLILAVPPGTDEPHTRALHAQLMQHLQAHLLAPFPAYLNQTQVVPQELLPIALADDPQAAFAEHLQRAIPPLLRTLQEFIAARTWDESRRVLHAHPELLSDEADQLLAQLIDAARTQNNADAEKMLAEHHDLLQRARREGIDAAFDRRAIESHGSAGASRVNAADAAADASRLEPSSTSASRRFESAEDVAARLRELNIQSPEDFERALREHPDLAEALQRELANALPPLLRALQEFITADSRDEAKTILHAHPELLSDEADQLLAQLIDAARAQNDADAEKMLAEHRDLLQRARREGIEAAFDRRAIESHGSAGASRVNAADAAADASRLEPSSTSASRRFESAEDVAARLRELNIQSPEDFERALREHPDLEALQRELANALPPLLRALQEFITADSRDEAKTILHAHPELLSDEADQLLAQLIDAARTQNDADAEKMLAEHHDLLQRARREGIDAAFDRRAIESHGSDASRVNAADADADEASRLEPTFTSASRQFELAALLQEITRLTRLSDMPRKIELCEQALRLVQRESNPPLWGALQNEIANALAQNPLGNRAENLERAIEHYELALQVYTREAFPEEWALTQNNLAAAYSDRIRGERAENLERAIAHYELALQVYTREAFPEEWAMTQNNLAIAYRNRIRGERAENLERAIEHYERALQVYTRETFPEEWAMTQNNLANAYAQRIRGERAENLERAIAHYELALQVYTREAFPEDWAGTQNNLANAYAQRIRGERAENLERAIAHYELALQVRTREAFPEQWALTQNNLAAAYSDRIRGERAENLERAIAHYELALQVYTREAFPEEWAMTQNNLAIAYRNRIRGERAENLERAIEHYERALQVRTRETFPEEWAMTQNNLANAYAQRIRGERAENLERAIAHYELALQVYTREAFPEDWAGTQNNLATAYRNRIRGERAENLERAIAHYELALQVYTREAFPEQWAMTQNNLANAYRNRIRGERAENLERAIAHYELALQVYTREVFPREHRLTTRNLGDTHASRGDWDAARAAYAQAIQTAEQLFRSAVDPTNQRNEARELADLYDRDIKACLHLDKRPMTKDERPMTNDESLRPPSFVLRPSSAALLAAEAARSRAFLKQMGLREVAPPTDIPAPLIAREQTIIEQLRQIEAGLADVHPRAERASERERALVAQRGALVRELDEMLDAMLAATPAAREYVALRRGETPTWDDLRALAERLGKDAALVEFHTLADQIVAMVWRAGWDAPQLVALPLARDRLLYRYLLPYQDEALNYAQHAGAGRAIHNDWLALGEELLAPLVERRSDGASLLGDASLVYFIPHGALHLVPLHALTVRGKPFIAERAVAYAPSAAVLARALKDEGRKTNDEGPKTKDEGRKTNLQSAIENRKSLVMGYALREEECPTFIGEAVEVAKLFGVAPLVDDAATKSALAQHAPSASLIHLSCHGVFNADDALASAVVLADGVFTAREWMGLKLRADLVTLSACQLAFSDVNPGDDLVGMTRALFYAGASAVLLALWSVRTDTTMAWMRDFYARVRAGQAKISAHRDATLELLRAHPDDPYIWAPFVLVG